MIKETNELFSLGYLAAIDALLDMPMREVLAEIPVNDDIRRALPGYSSH